jgi:hypothetical protein
MIIMGDDEFILHVRKNGFGQKSKNPELGRKIWVWIRARDPGATQIPKIQACRWGDTGLFVSDDDLPKTATQFQFDEAILPELYRFLSTL